MKGDRLREESLKVKGCPRGFSWVDSGALFLLMRITRRGTNLGVGNDTFGLSFT